LEPEKKLNPETGFGIEFIYEHHKISIESHKNK
jgi:hypothetical protein